MTGPPMKTRPCPPWLGVAATRSSATARSEAGADRFTFPSTPQRDDPLGTSAYHRESRRAHRRAAGLLGTPMLTGVSLFGGRGHSAPHGVSSPLRPGMFQRRAWYHAHARKPR